MPPGFYCMELDPRPWHDRTRDERQVLTNQFFETCGDVLEAKSDQYSIPGAEFAYLQALCRDLQCRPIGVVLVFIEKHLQGLRRLLKKRLVTSTEMEEIESRLTDIANYCAIGMCLETWVQESANGVLYDISDKPTTETPSQDER